MEGKNIVENPKGKLVIIGGAEDKEGDCLILKKYISLAGKKEARILILTAATEKAQDTGKLYKEVFYHLGVSLAEYIDLQDRKEANRDKIISMLDGITGVFFTGGDQLKITSALGGTKLIEKIFELYNKGLVIAGTSAGASVMSATMIINGEGDDSPCLDALQMSPGLGFVSDVVIDQHFAQRGRIGRLLIALGRNPSMIGLGIDEDTSVILDGDKIMVCGSNTVTILDGSNISHSNAYQTGKEKNLALTDIRMHTLPYGYGFDLNSRAPIYPKKGNSERKQD